MFQWIIHTSLRQRLIVLAASLLLVVYGLMSIRQMPVDVFPDLNKPTVTLMTEAGGMAPEEVEQLVSFPIESAMNGMSGVTRATAVANWGNQRSRDCTSADRGFPRVRTAAWGRDVNLYCGAYRGLAGAGAPGEYRYSLNSRP